MSTLIAGAFVLGLASTLHCLGMCGGIIGALTFGLPEPIRESRKRLLPFVSAYNLGRLSSYSLLGALAGLFGEQLFSFVSPRSGHQILQWLATALMVGIGLYLAGWLPQFTVVERMGVPVWKKLSPLARKLTPIDSPVKAYGFGLLWGWLPCGMVYGALVWSTTAGNAGNGALLMLAFGAGTLPATMGAGIFTGWIARLSQNRQARRLAGISIIALALAGLFAFSGSAHHDHDRPTNGGGHQHQNPPGHDHSQHQI